MINLLLEHWKLFLIIFIVQGCIGVLIFEISWKRVERVRPDKSEEAMHAEFPSFRRPDTHMWKRSNYYPGCFLMLVPRTLWIFFWFFAVGFLNMICYMGQPMEQPL